nr:MAG TPA: hypothetical protein [Caudoviricetes sp.]
MDRYDLTQGFFCVIMNIHHRQELRGYLIALFYICDSHR